MTVPALHMKCWTVSVQVLDWFLMEICNWEGTRTLMSMMRMSYQASVTANCKLLSQQLPIRVSAWTSSFVGNITHSLSRLQYCRNWVWVLHHIMSHSYSEIQQVNHKQCSCDSILASDSSGQIRSSIGKYLILTGDLCYICVQLLFSQKIYQLILIMLLFTCMLFIYYRIWTQRCKTSTVYLWLWQILVLDLLKAFLSCIHQAYQIVKNEYERIRNGHGLF